MKTSHIVLAAVGVLVVAAAGYLIYKPYQTAKNIQAAVVAQNPDVLLEYVNTDAVQVHLQTYFKEQLQRDLAAKNYQSNLLVLGDAMGDVMVERAAWEYGTREAIVRTLLNGRPTKRDEPLKPLQQPPIEQADIGYKGIGRFQIDVPGEEPISLVLTRAGLGWKVTEVNFNP